jgi:hypothetical protein
MGLQQKCEICGAPATKESMDGQILCQYRLKENERRIQQSYQKLGKINRAMVYAAIITGIIALVLIALMMDSSRSLQWST